MRYFDLFEILSEKSFIQPHVNSANRPIAFTEEGVRNFWKWFGRSKVVDKEGCPRVVFHGTKQDFKSYDPERANTNTGTGVPHSAFVFSNDVDVAASYSVDDPDHSSFGSEKLDNEFKALMISPDYSWDKHMQFLHDHERFNVPQHYDGGNIKPVYLKILKPLVIDAKGDQWNEVYFQPKGYRSPETFTTNELMEYAMDNGYDGLIVKNVKDRQRGTGKPATTYAVVGHSK